ncbi:MAG TPA: hypothetical protein VFF07_12045 [Actinomycetota bacterium]|nr:hypothetical protein [Actinomycetota bacterium]
MKLLLSAALALLGFVACTSGPNSRAPDADRGAASPIDVNSSPGGAPACEPNYRDLSYGKTIPGRWLEEVIVSLGAPGGHPASISDIRNTGTALWIDIPAYKESSTIYATMITPDTDSNVASLATEKRIGRRGSYLLYFNKGNSAWQSYRAASNGTWQLSLLAYPSANSDVVAWPRGIIDWLNETVDRAEQSPPQCQGPIT